jgi:hypothetical protein
VAFFNHRWTQMGTDGGGGILVVAWTTEDTEYTGVDGVLGAMVFGFGPSTLPPLLR